MKAKENMPRLCRVKRAFTIVEVVVIIAVIAILATILVPVFSNLNGDAEAMALKLDIQGAYTAFVADNEFGDETYLPIGDCLFLKEGTFEYTPAGDATNASFSRLEGGFRLENDKEDVESVAAENIRDPDEKTSVRGPYNGYYIVEYDVVWPWDGSGTKADPFTVVDYKSLRTISEFCSRGEDFTGKHFKLTTSEITISKDTWLPIGGYINPTTKDSTENTSFRGNFDGGGHLITIDYGKRMNRENYTLFGKTKDATINNLRTAGNINTGGYGWTAGIVGYANNTKIYNCTSSVNMTAGIMAGGIAAQIVGNTQISSCINQGKVTATGMTTSGYNNLAGGIVGVMEPNTVIRSCQNKGVVTGNGGVIGGIVGYAQGKVINCQNDAAVTAKGYAPLDNNRGTNKDASVGGIAGYGGMKGLIDGCVNNGEIKAYNADTNTYYRSVGGIVGVDALVRNCVNTGNITGSAYVGGIAGYQNGTSACSMYNNINKGAIASKGDTFTGVMTGPVGGILGGVDDTNGFRFAMNVNCGTASHREGDGSVSSYNRIGSLIGSANGVVDFEFCFSVCRQGITVGNTSQINQVIGPAVQFVEDTKGIPLGTAQKKSGIFYADLAHLGASGYPDKKLDHPNYYFPWAFSSVHGAFNDIINNPAPSLASYKQPEFHHWKCYGGFNGGLCAPVGTKYSVTYNLGTILAQDSSVAMEFNTAFLAGDDIAYVPYLNKTHVIKGNMQYTFQGWSDGTKTYQSGEKITLTKDTTLTAVWKSDTYTIRPVPFP
ncbi:MAG: InlB B-repeat-containing protein [Clostridia bacterium]|nr:InlB B-repeat-containing protein [Clostridia bacterium]